jgi:hypothetical protein
MKAREYLETYQKLIFHFELISQIVEDLYRIRHDKEATDSYYKLLLIADIRYYEWGELGQKHGYTGLLVPNEFKHKEEIDRSIAEDIRSGLLEVVKNDRSFGYITYLLSKQAITQAIILEVEQALEEEKEMTLQENYCENRKSAEINKRTKKITTAVLVEILKKIGVEKNSTADGTKIANLISYITGFSANTIRQHLSNNEELTTTHKKEIENLNQLLQDLNIEIRITYNKHK